MKAIKRDLLVNGTDLPILLAAEVGAWLFGILMVVVIMATTDAGDEGTYFSMGLLMCLIFTLFITLIYDGAGYQTRYQMALSMSCTRREQLFVHVLGAFLRVLLFIGIAWVLGKLELVLYRAIYPAMTNEVDFFVIFRWKYILTAAAAATVMALLISAFFGRFGAKGGLIIYFSALLTFFLAMRVISAEPDSLLGRFGALLAGWFGGVRLAAWIVLGSIAVIVLLVISVRMLLRQEVRF